MSVLVLRGGCMRLAQVALMEKLGSLAGTVPADDVSSPENVVNSVWCGPNAKPTEPE